MNKIFKKFKALEIGQEVFELEKGISINPRIIKSIKPDRNNWGNILIEIYQITKTDKMSTLDIIKQAAEAKLDKNIKTTWLSVPSNSSNIITTNIFPPIVYTTTREELESWILTSKNKP